MNPFSTCDIVTSVVRKYYRGDPFAKRSRRENVEPRQMMVHLLRGYKIPYKELVRYFLFNGLITYHSSLLANVKACENLLSNRVYRIRYDMIKQEVDELYKKLWKPRPIKLIELRVHINGSGATRIEPQDEIFDNEGQLREYVEGKTKQYKKECKCRVVIDPTFQDVATLTEQ